MSRINGYWFLRKSRLRFETRVKPSSESSLVISECSGCAWRNYHILFQRASIQPEGVEHPHCGISEPSSVTHSEEQRDKRTIRPVQQTSWSPVVLHQKIPIPVAARYTFAKGRATLSKFFPNLVLGISGLVTLAIELRNKRPLRICLSTEPRANNILIRREPYPANGFHLSKKAGDILDLVLCRVSVSLARSAHSFAKPPFIELRPTIFQLLLHYYNRRFKLCLEGEKHSPDSTFSHLSPPLSPEPRGSSSL